MTENEKLLQEIELLLIQLQYQSGYAKPISADYNREACDNEQ